MYEISFAKLSERYFKSSSWPPVHMVQDLVDQDHVFCLLYKVPDVLHREWREGLAVRGGCAVQGH